MIETQRLDEIATWMKAFKATDLPAILKGVFFMDGNPLPDHCLTMNNLDWDTASRTLFLPVSAPIQWTFHRSVPGWLLLRGSQLSRFTYKITFVDDSLLQAQVIPFVLGIPIPTWFVNATMSREENSNGDIWARKNVWFGGIPRIGEYTLRRVVDAEGEYTPALTEMLTKVDDECWVITSENIRY
jgi:hypothetical protein